MKLIWHILRKDLRRHRWEILLYVLACASWALETAKPLLWQPTRNLIPIVFFGAWVLITIRVVQGESLVGDREFWITRPYRWPQLLIAKVCFLLLCVNVPFLIAQMALLAYAGIPLVWSFLPGLFFLQLWFASFFTFPAAVLASITESLVQWILTALGVIVFAMVMSWLPWNKLPATLAGQENTASFVGAALIVPALVFALLWQYARRRVWPARLAAAAAVLMVPLTVLIAPTRAIRSLAYAAPDGPTPIHLSIPEDGAGGGRTYTRRVRRFVSDSEISIPLTVNTTDPDTLIDADGWSVTLSGDGGWQWQSPWINHSFHFGSDAETTSVSFDMPADVAKQLAEKHAKARVELAFSVYRLGALRRIETGGEHFTLGDGITCGWSPRHLNYFKIDGEGEWNDIQCVAPLRLPEIFLMATESGENTCPVAKGAQPLPAGHHAVIVNNGTSLPAEFDPDPVRRLDPVFRGWNPAIPGPGDSVENIEARLCRGTPLTVRSGSSVRKMKATFDLGSIGTEKTETADTED